MSRFRSRRGCPGGSTVRRLEGLHLRAQQRLEALGEDLGQLELLAAPLLGRCPVPGVAQQRACARRREHPGGHPAADVELLRAGHHQGDDRRARADGDQRGPWAEGSDAARWPGHGPLRHLDEHAAVAHDRQRRCDVTVHAHPAAPDRQQAAEPVDQALARARGEGRRAAAQEPGTRLHGKRMHDDERVHPAAMRGADEQVAAAGQVLLAGRLDPEPEHPETGEPGDQPQEPVQERCLRLPGSAPATRGPRGRRPAGRPRERPESGGRVAGDASRERSRELRAQAPARRSLARPPHLPRGRGRQAPSAVRAPAASEGSSVTSAGTSASGCIGRRLEPRGDVGITRRTRAARPSGRRPRHPAGA